METIEWICARSWPYLAIGYLALIGIQSFIVGMIVRLVLEG
jgi:hypothetical protein